MMRFHLNGERFRITIGRLLKRFLILHSFLRIAIGSSPVMSYTFRRTDRLETVRRRWKDLKSGALR